MMTLPVLFSSYFRCFNIFNVVDLYNDTTDDRAIDIGTYCSGRSVVTEREDSQKSHRDQ